MLAILQVGGDWKEVRVFFKATGGSEIDNFFRYTRLLMVRLALLVGKMVMVRLFSVLSSQEREY